MGEEALTSNFLLNFLLKEFQTDWDKQSQSSLDFNPNLTTTTYNFNVLLDNLVSSTLYLLPSPTTQIIPPSIFFGINSPGIVLKDIKKS